MADRQYLAPMGEYCSDLLTIDSWINGRTKGIHATSLLCEKLQEREAQIKERIQYLAEKRGITPKELQQQILDGNTQDLDK